MSGAVAPRPVRRLPRTGLRTSITLGISGIALTISAVLAIGTYVTARHYLIEQREKTAARQAFADASYLRDGLLTSGAEVSDVLGSLSPAAGSTVVIRRDGQWYSSSLTMTQDEIPDSLRDLVAAGRAGTVWGGREQGPVVMVGVGLAAIDAEFYEIAPTTELDDTLTLLAITLAAFALLTAVGGALIGRAAAGRVMGPLQDVASAAARIAVGEMGTRLPSTQDPDLTVIVGSFNTMVEVLDERIQHDARFAADVSHELRSPVTTMMTSVGLLAESADRLSERDRTALSLVEGELSRLHHSLEQLLELSRLEAGVGATERDVLDLGDLVSHALAESGRPRHLAASAGRPILVRGNKSQLRRLLVNLFDNADLHGGGLSAVGIGTQHDVARITVDDDGPGVPPRDRERIFQRFVRAGSRGSRPGTGLGLSLATETAHSHSGSLRCEANQPRGARFVLLLPLVSHRDQS